MPLHQQRGRPTCRILLVLEEVPNMPAESSMNVGVCPSLCGVPLTCVWNTAFWRLLRETVNLKTGRGSQRPRQRSLIEVLHESLFNWIYQWMNAGSLAQKAFQCYRAMSFPMGTETRIYLSWFYKLLFLLFIYIPPCFLTGTWGSLQIK